MAQSKQMEKLAKYFSYCQTVTHIEISFVAVAGIYMQILLLR